MRGPRHFFSETRIQDYMNEVRDRMQAEIETLPVDQLAPDDDELCEYFAKKYAVQVPILGEDIGAYPPAPNLHSDSVTLTLHIPFEGNGVLFDVQPAVSPGICESWDVKGNTLRIQVSGSIARPQEFSYQKDHIIGEINKGLANLREDVSRRSPHLKEWAREKIEWRRRRESAHDAFIAEASKVVSIRRRTDGTAEFVVPVIRKAIPIPPSPRTSEPLLEMASYEDILRAINSMVHVFERSPSAFRRMEEEELRAVLLVGLNGLYEGQATGETFNNEGKTDILIRHDDKNVFIAECLIWDGEEKCRKKLDKQLFHYATWRDSKLALIVFNRKVGFSDVVEKMKKMVSGHPQCASVMEYKHDTGARYRFKRADDPKREFIVTCLAFDVPCEH